MILIIDFIFLFLIAGIVIKLINVYVKTYDNIKRIKEIREERKAENKNNDTKCQIIQFNNSKNKQKNKIDTNDDWIQNYVYDPETKSFKQK